MLLPREQEAGKRGYLQKRGESSKSRGMTDTVSGCGLLTISVQLRIGQKTTCSRGWFIFVDSFKFLVTLEGQMEAKLYGPIGIPWPRRLTTDFCVQIQDKLTAKRLTLQGVPRVCSSWLLSRRVLVCNSLPTHLPETLKA